MRFMSSLVMKKAKILQESCKKSCKGMHSSSIFSRFLQDFDSELIFFFIELGFVICSINNSLFQRCFLRHLAPNFFVPDWYLADLNPLITRAALLLTSCISNLNVALMLFLIGTIPISWIWYDSNFCPYLHAQKKS